MALSFKNDQLSLVANTIRMLSADGVEKANSGHPGMPMGAADYATVLWLKHLRFNPQEPTWIARDRFVLSNGHGSMLLYSLLHLAGYGLTLEDLKSFRQWESKTPGHPESHMTVGVEATTGPLGQGISNAVGMALGQKLLQARYDAENTGLFNHKVFTFVGDGCLMEGVSSEASSVAGHLGLDNLIVIYDDNHISIAGDTALAFSEDVPKRYEAYGWHTQSIDGHNLDQIDRAIQNAMKEKGRPSFIAARTIIGKGAPTKAGDAEVHGAPLGKDELEKTKKGLNWPQEPTFYVPDETSKIFASRVEELKEQYADWQKKFEGWQQKYPDRAKALTAQRGLTLPTDLAQKLVASLPKPEPMATRKLSGIVLQAASKEVNALVGGSADLEPSTLTLIKGSSDVSKKDFSGKNIRFGVREHGMGAIMNGLSYYGGYIPYGSTFLCFADYMRPTIRLAALAEIPGLFIFTHESVFLGEDGPTHQPIEHFNALRIIPNVQLFRPADGVETAMSYAIALERRDGPSIPVFTRQNLDPLDRPASFTPDDIRKGAYTVYESTASPELVLIATGSEVSLAVKSALELAKVRSVRVVSMPCWELFDAQPELFRRTLIPEKAKKVVIEAGSPFGWQQMIGGSPEDTTIIGIDHFGASAPAKIIAEKFGFTPKAVVETIQKRFPV